MSRSSVDLQEPSLPHTSGKYLDQRNRGNAGGLCLKKLKPIHHTIIKLHLIGKRNNEIALQLGKSAPYISLVLNDPLAKAAIDEGYKDLDAEFRALYVNAIQAIRKGLDHKNPSVALNAADKYFKAHGQYKPEEKTETQTAEDVIARMLEMQRQMIANGQMTLNINVSTQESAKAPIDIQQEADSDVSHE